MPAAISAHVIRSEIMLFLTDRKSRQLSTNTIEFYERELDLFSRWANDQEITTLEEVTPDTVRRYMIFLQNKGRNPGGIHAFYRSARAFLRWWESEIEPIGWHNPINKIQPPKINTDPLPGINRDDFLHLVSVCDTNTWYDTRDRALLLTLYDTGLRRAELIALLIRDLDLETGTIYIRAGKGDKRRVVFAGAHTRKSIGRWLRKHPAPAENSPLFVTRRGDPFSPGGLRQMIINRAKKAGIPVPGLHDFRRAFALQSLNNGMDIFSLQRLMGHSSLTVLRRYLNQNDGDLRRAHAEHGPVDTEY